MKSFFLLSEKVDILKIFVLRVTGRKCTVCLHFIISQYQIFDTHILSHIDSVLYFGSLFTSGTHQDCEEAGGDGLVVSGNRSAGAGAGEKPDSSTCFRNLVLGR